MNIPYEPAIVSSIIAGFIALVALLIQTSISISKNSYDKKSNFEKTLIDKLEKVYSPFHMALKLSEHKKYLIDNTVEELINKYGHLLSSNLLEDVKTLIYFEYEQRKLIEDERKYSSKQSTKPRFFEYDALRKKVFEVTKQEFSELQEIHDKNFNAFKRKINYNTPEKMMSFIGRFFGTITLVTCTFLLIWWTLSSNTPKDIFIIIMTLLSLISVTTLLFSLTALVGRLVEKLAVRSGKSQRLFSFNEYVPDTSEYKCICCGFNVKKIKYSKFNFCPESHTFKQTLRGFMFLSKWKRNTKHKP
jgi:hypothetical protein